MPMTKPRQPMYQNTHATYEKASSLGKKLDTL